MTPRTIRGRTAGGDWHELQANTSTKVPLVIAHAINAPGFYIYHQPSGGGIVHRSKVRELRPLLYALLATDIDWAQPLDTLSARSKVGEVVRRVVSAIDLELALPDAGRLHP